MKHFANWIGTIIAIGSVFFIATKLFNSVDALSAKHLLNEKLLLLTLISSFFYAMNLCFLAHAWQQLVLAEGAHVSKHASFVIFGKSQIAKYLPGNIFHLAGRQVLGRLYGISHQALIRSSVWELALLSMAGAMIGSISFVFKDFSSHEFILVVGLIFLTLLFFIYKNQRIKSLFLYCIFHLVAGLIFLITLLFLQTTNIFPSYFGLIVIGAYALAWLAGFLTPGAPGGVGVREVVLYASLGAWLPEDMLLMALLFSRLTTTLGDLWFFLIAMMQSKKVDAVT